MRLRELGRTGFKVSEIGFGGWGIGKSEWMGAEDSRSLETLKAARDAGIIFFDTALAYGDGHSEALIARAFGKSQEVIVASKVPPKNLLWPTRPESMLFQLKKSSPGNGGYLSVSCVERRLGRSARVAGNRKKDAFLWKNACRRDLN